MTTNLNANPALACFFRVEIDGVQVASFQECSEIEFKHTVGRTREGADPPYKKSYQGLPEFPDITLKKQLRDGAAADNKTLSDWQKAGASDKKSVAIVDYNFEGTEIRRSNLYGAWCPSFKKGPHDATSDDAVVIDEMVLAYDHGEHV